MPVLYLGRNVNHISRVQFLSGFAPLLIITPTRRTKKNLTAVMVDVPVVPAKNWATVWFPEKSHLSESQISS